MSTPSEPTQPPFAQPLQPPQPPTPQQSTQPEAAQPQRTQLGAQAPVVQSPTAPPTAAPTAWQDPTSPVGQPAGPTSSGGGRIGALVCLAAVIAWVAAHAVPTYRLSLGADDFRQTIEYWLLPIQTITGDSVPGTYVVPLGIGAHILCVVLALTLAIVGLVRRQAVWSVVAAAMLLTRLVPEIATVLGNYQSQGEVASLLLGTWLAVAAIVLAVASLISLLLKRTRR